MDLAIVCQACQGSGVRVNVIGYSGTDAIGDMVVPRRCAECSGSGRIVTSGWSVLPDPRDDR